MRASNRCCRAAFEEQEPKARARVRTDTTNRRGAGLYRYAGGEATHESQRRGTNRLTPQSRNRKVAERREPPGVPWPNQTARAVPLQRRAHVTGEEV